MKGWENLVRIPLFPIMQGQGQEQIHLRGYCACACVGVGVHVFLGMSGMPQERRWFILESVGVSK